MIRSMTAFARCQTSNEWGELTWELRSVNHRYLESHLRLPEDLRALEPAVRERLNKRLGRGKVDAGLRFKPRANANSQLQLNQPLLDQLLQVADQLQKQMPNAHGVTVADMLRWPGVLETEEQDLTPLQQAALTLLDEAISQLIEVRGREGSRLAELIEQRMVGMREQVERARVRIPQVLDGVRERLTNRLAEVTEQLDQDRLAQEMVLLAQRLDVDEEMDRLSTHLDEVANNLKKDEPVGRRLDFLMQELNREANTLGSKSVDSEITAISVEMKVLIEQMREQVQNLE